MVTWELAIAIGIGVIGGAGVGGFIKSLADMTKPARLHRRIGQLKDVRDALSADSPARAALDQMVDDHARGLLAHLANAPARRRNTIVFAVSATAVAAGIVVAVMWGDDVADAVGEELILSVVTGVASVGVVVAVSSLVPMLAARKWGAMTSEERAEAAARMTRRLPDLGRRRKQQDEG